MLESKSKGIQFSCNFRFEISDLRSQNLSSSNFGLPAFVFVYVPAELTLWPKPQSIVLSSLTLILFPARNLIVILHFWSSAG